MLKPPSVTGLKQCTHFPPPPNWTQEYSMAELHPQPIWFYFLFWVRVSWGCTGSSWTCDLSASVSLRGWDYRCLPLCCSDLLGMPVAMNPIPPSNHLAAETLVPCLELLSPRMLRLIWLMGSPMRELSYAGFMSPACFRTLHLWFCQREEEDPPALWSPVVVAGVFSNKEQWFSYPERA